MSLRLIELLLFFLPITVFLLSWWFGRLAPSPPLLGVCLVALAILGGALVYFGIERRIDPGERYVPAQLVGGEIVAGHGVDH
jgi:hypothetical protein